MKKYIFMFAAIMATVLVIACTVSTSSTSSDVPGDKIYRSLDSVEHKIVLAEGALKSENEKISVNQGENVKLQFVSDMEMEVHLHGYDLKLTVNPNKESVMQFVAEATGRFAITSHAELGSYESHKSHREHAKLFESETLLKGDSFQFEITDDLSESTIIYHDHMSHSDSGKIVVSQEYQTADEVEILISDSGFSPVEVMVGPSTSIKWISDKGSKVRVTSGAAPGVSHASYGSDSHVKSHDKHGEKESHDEKTLLVVEVRP
ncbi:hypothetical protein M1N90_00460 [Dehalococcoidia bacterium]|nr:hypothetical protein [Dehalococcoidia bacterium]